MNGSAPQSLINVTTDFVIGGNTHAREFRRNRRRDVIYAGAVKGLPDRRHLGKIHGEPLSL
jgi:hypothetical protein